MAKKKPNDYGTDIPLHEVETLARVLLPDMQKFFESEEEQKGFRERKGKHKYRKQAPGNACGPVFQYNL